jgi:hypothetical protein
MGQERHELPRAEWRPFFETLTKDYQGADVTVEVLSREYGDQVEIERLPFAYLEYDHKDDAFSVAVGGRDGHPVEVRHVVEHPRAIFADPTLPNIPWTFDVVADDGTQSIITVRFRPALQGE